MKWVKWIRALTNAVSEKCIWYKNLQKKRNYVSKYHLGETEFSVFVICFSVFGSDALPLVKSKWNAITKLNTLMEIMNIRDCPQISLLILREFKQTRKTTGFKSLRLNYWEINLATSKFQTDFWTKLAKMI